MRPRGTGWVFFFLFCLCTGTPPKLDLRLPSTSSALLRREGMFIMMQNCLGETQSKHFVFLTVSGSGYISLEQLNWSESCLILFQVGRKSLVNRKTAANTLFLLCLMRTSFPSPFRMSRPNSLRQSERLKAHTEWLQERGRQRGEWNHYSPIRLAMEAVLIIFPYPCFNITRPAA